MKQILIFCSRFTGSEKEHPIRSLDLNAYTDPITFVGSDGSGTSNILSTTYKSIIHTGTVKTTGNVQNEIINEGTGSSKYCILV